MVNLPCYLAAAVAFLFGEMYHYCFYKSLISCIYMYVLNRIDGMSNNYNNQERDTQKPEAIAECNIS